MIHKLRYVHHAAIQFPLVQNSYRTFSLKFKYTQRMKEHGPFFCKTFEFNRLYHVIHAMFVTKCTI